MLTVVAVLHLLVALSLVFLVLVQDSKGDSVGSAFGGGSNSVLSATGATSLLVKATRVMVVIFAATSILLTRMTASNVGSVVDKGAPTPTEQRQAADAAKAPAPQTAPAAAGAIPNASSPNAAPATAPVTEPKK